MKKRLLLFVAVLIFSVSVQTFGQQRQVSAAAKRVVTTLKNKDMRRLATFVHPTKGVRFSPYGFINTETDLIFKKSQVPNLMLLRRTYLWGSYDGSGDPINLGFPGYYQKFIYDSDFARAPQVSYNRKIGSGNTTFNLAEVYPTGKFVEYYFPGKRKSGGMDWRSLRLIFEKSGARWYLVGVSHDQWTI